MVKGVCIIREKSIVVDGQLFFADPLVDLDTFLIKAYDHLAIAYPKFYKMDKLSKLGFLAAEVLLKAHPVENVAETALVLSNASASLDTDLRFEESTHSIASPALFVYTLSNIVAGEICIRHKMKGENAFFVSSAFEPSRLISYVEAVLRDSPGISCVAGWLEVMGEHHDVFLYLYDHSSSGSTHSAADLNKLYNGIWNN